MLLPSRIITLSLGALLLPSGIQIPQALAKTNIENIVYYKTVLEPEIVKRINPDNIADIKTVKRQLEAIEDIERNKAAYQDWSAKEPGHSAFWTVRNNGDAPEPSIDLMHREKIYGLNYLDHQYLTFHFTDDQGHVLIPVATENPSNNRIEYCYTNVHGQKATILRTDQLQNNQLHQIFTIQNIDAKPLLLSLNYHSDVRSLFQVRDMVTPHPGLHKQSWLTLQKSPEFESTMTVVPPKNQKKNQQILPLSDTFKTRVEIEQGRQFIDIQKIDNTTLKLNIHTPVQRKIWIRIGITPHDQDLDARYREPEAALAQIWPFKKPDTYPAGFNPKIWQVAESDLQKLLIPVPIQVDIRTGQPVSKDVPENTSGIKTMTCYMTAAGIPLYVTSFGRDSVIASLFTLNYNPRLAHDTLYVLSYYQGQKDNNFTEEEAGKIMHQLGKDILSRSHLLPFSPYYGSVDATPLYLILFHQYVTRAKDWELMRALWPNYQAALDYMERNIEMADKDEHSERLRGFLRQRDIAKISPPSPRQGGTSKQNIRGEVFNFENIGWKDSPRALKVLLDQHGYLKNPEKPFALAELQAYVYGARAGAVELYRIKAAQTSDPDEKKHYLDAAERYEKENIALKEKFNRQFWMEDKNFIAMALDAQGEAVRVVSSNGAQTL